MTYKVCWSTLCMFVLLISPAGGDDLQGMLVYIVYVCIADTTCRRRLPTRYVGLHCVCLYCWYQPPGEMTHKVCWSTLYMFVLLIPPGGGDDLQGMLVYIVYVCIADTTRRGR